MMSPLLPAAEVLVRLRVARIVPVIVIDDPDDAVPLARALTGGGLTCAEITFRTARASEALRRMTAEAPDILAGAGTVLTAAQAAEARDAGAQFVVAPGFNPRVVDYCQQHGIPVYPGVATPSEVEAALATGITTMKFFPAESLGGLAYLKAIAAPYGDVNFIPTGGVTQPTLRATSPTRASWRAAGRGWPRVTGSGRGNSTAFAKRRDEPSRRLPASLPG